MDYLEPERDRTKQLEEGNDYRKCRANAEQVIRETLQAGVDQEKLAKACKFNSFAELWAAIESLK